MTFTLKHAKNLCLFILLGAAMMPLAGCMDRDAADKTLVNACQKAGEVLLTDQNTVKSINQKSFGKPANIDNGDRFVTLNLTISDGWLDQDKIWTCTFVEKSGLMGGYSAELYSMDIDGEVYGNIDGAIHGTFDLWQKITAATGAILK